MKAVARVSDAFVAYPSPAGTVMALRGLDLVVAEGERLLIQGPNGSGKSTLMRLLTGEQEVTAGRVEVAGTDLTKLGAMERRRWRRAGVGVVDQHARRALLPEWRVVENVALQLRLAGSSRRTALATATATLDRLGLSDLGDRSVSTLSGGEAQRVAICAALAHDPALILADEPTGELDEKAAREVYQLLSMAGRSHGAALVLISHDRRATESVDRAVRMREGRLAEQWIPSEGPAESQVVDGRGWVRLPAPMLGRSSAVRAEQMGMRAEAITVGDIRLVADGTPAPDSARAKPRPVPGVIGVGEPADVAVLPPAVPFGPPLVRMAGVDVTFGDRALFRHLDLSVRAGEFVVLRGPSGSGKSTLLGLAAGLIDPDAGTVEIAGTTWGPLDRAARSAWRRGHVAVALQSTILAEALTVEENLKFAANLRGCPDDQAQPVAAALGLTPLWRQPVRLLSGGERQRVAVARCLVSAADLILLDEPTSQQDEASALAVVRAVRAATDGGRAILAASHDHLFLGAAGTQIDMRRLAPHPEPV